MGPVLLVMLAALAVGESAAKGVRRVASVECSNDYSDGDSLYNYTAEDIWGERNISLSKFRGKVGAIHYHQSFRYAPIKRCLFSRKL